MTRMEGAIAGAVAAKNSSSRAGINRRIVIGTTVGNALEIYDFTVYSFLAVTLGKLFFPHFSDYSQLLLSVGTFGVGFFMRPLGGLVLGAYADRVGRKAGMTATLLLMALGSLMIGLAPTYAAIGPAAPLIIVVARLLQGFSAGGEIGASTAMLLEYPSANRRNFFGSWQVASQGIGAMFGAVVASALSHFMDPESFMSWGWRVPFILGVAILPIGIYLRRIVKDEPVPLTAKPGKTAFQSGFVVLRELLTTHRRVLGLGIVSVMGGSASAYIVMFYMPLYAITQLGLPMPLALLAGILTGALTALVAPIVGIVADRFGCKMPSVIARLLLALLVVPAFVFLNRAPTITNLLLVVGALSVLQVATSASMAMVPSLLPKHVRATGIAVMYAVGVAIFGGFSQFIATWLIHVTGSKISPAYYMMVCVGLSVVAVLVMEDKSSSDIDS